MKPTIGIVPGAGICPIGKSSDSAGPLAKTPRDVANLLTLLVDPSKTSVPARGCVSVLGRSWSDIRVGAFDSLVWTLPPYVIRLAEEATREIVGSSNQCIGMTLANNAQLQATNEAYARIKSLAKTFHANLSDQSDGAFMLDGASAIQSRLSEYLVFRDVL